MNAAFGCENACMKEPAAVMKTAANDVRTLSEPAQASISAPLGQADLPRRRRSAASPVNPIPNKASEAGSGISF